MQEQAPIVRRRQFTCPKILHILSKLHGSLRLNITASPAGNIVHNDRQFYGIGNGRIVDDQAVSWAYAEEVYDCHQTLMGRYQKEFMVKERFFRQSPELGLPHDQS